MDADALERLIAEIGTLRESVEELYLVLDHAWRNRQEIYDLLDPPSACSHCEDKNESDVEPSAANINGEVVEALRLLLQELDEQFCQRRHISERSLTDSKQNPLQQNLQQNLQRTKKTQWN